MARVATQPAPGSLASNSLQIGGRVAALKKVGGAGGAMVKRKTPSELRGEQLKRTNVVEIADESLSPLSGVTNSSSNNELKKPDVPRNPRYIDTRMDEVYPAKKSRFRVLLAKENAKENTSTEQIASLRNITMLSNLADKRLNSSSENPAVSSVFCEEGRMQARQTIERCSQSIFRSVTELSSNGEKSTSIAVVDMDKALKGLVAQESPSNSASTAGFSKNFGNHTSIRSGNFFSEFLVPGSKVPLDFTLKTKMRVASSCSVNWIHRSIMCSAYNGLLQLTSQFGSENSSSSEHPLVHQILSSKALHSWVYPQSTLPPSVISILNTQAAGDFLRKRQLAWEDSFRSLYYMLRKNICSIFYVCTSHFVAMFICDSGSAGTNYSCNAYISQSTRGLRSLLREHDVCFSMPLGHCKEEQATAEDLVELSEIEKQNLGQTRYRSFLSDVDNSPESLLAFPGNKNVHALYDFFLNYRSSLTFLSGVDVPVLYSPVPFQNAALSSPEIRCVEMKRVDHVASSPKDSKAGNGESLQGSSSGPRSSIEIKDTYIPSWIVCRVCALIRSQMDCFEASFMTDRTSIGLNIALQTSCEKTDSKNMTNKGLEESSHCYGIPEATVSPGLSSGFLKSLKYNNGCYTGSLSPLYDI